MDIREIVIEEIQKECEAQGREWIEPYNGVFIGVVFRQEEKKVRLHINDGKFYLQPFSMPAFTRDILAKQIDETPTPRGWVRGKDVFINNSLLKKFVRWFFKKKRKNKCTPI